MVLFSNISTYEKLCYQNKYCVVHLHVFSGLQKYQVLYKLKNMTPISCFKPLLMEMSYSYDK